MIPIHRNCISVIEQTLIMHQNSALIEVAVVCCKISLMALVPVGLVCILFAVSDDLVQVFEVLDVVVAAADVQVAAPEVLRLRLLFGLDLE